MQIKEITIEDSKKLLDEKKACFIDIRDKASYDESHIEGAIRLDESNVETFLANTDKAQIHIIYCYHGNSSKGASAYFYEKGVKEAYSMIGGYALWND